MATQTGDIKQLATLGEVSQDLASTLNLEAALHSVLEILEHHHSMSLSRRSVMSRRLCTALADGAMYRPKSARSFVSQSSSTGNQWAPSGVDLRFH